MGIVRLVSFSQCCVASLASVEITILTILCFSVAVFSLDLESLDFDLEHVLVVGGWNAIFSHGLLNLIATTAPVVDSFLKE